MSRFKKRFTKEEKIQMIQISMEQQYTINQLASNFGIASSTFYRWRKVLGDHPSLVAKDKLRVETGNKNMSEPISVRGPNSKIGFYKALDAMEHSKIEYAKDSDVVTRLKHAIELIKRVYGHELSTQKNEKIIHFRNSTY